MDTRHPLPPATTRAVPYGYSPARGAHHLDGRSSVGLLRVGQIPQAFPFFLVDQVPDFPSIALQVRQISDFTGAVADFVDGNSHAVQHGNEEVGHRGFGGVLYVAPWFQSSAGPAGQHGRKILV